MEVFAKYAHFEKKKTSILPLADYLISAFGLPTEGESWISIFDVVDKPNYARLAAGEDIDEGQPRAFLNYILYDKHHNFEGMCLDQVSEAAKIPDTDPHLHSHERLALDVTIQEEGFIYIYVSNDDEQNMDVYFDDLKVTHELSDVIAGADYYPFGLKMDGREITREDFRFGYQGQFAEEDEETGWNSFELRMYDPVIGRWISTDPAGQYFSPYLGMGNNPMNGVDPDGGYLFGLFGSTSSQRQEARQMAVNDPNLNISCITCREIKFSWRGSTSISNDNVWNQSMYETNIYNYTLDRDLNISYSGSNQIYQSLRASGEIDFDAFTQLSLGFLAVNAGVGLGAATLRVSTATGRAMFWSGVRSTTAAEFAAARGLTTLEMTQAGRFVTVAQRAVIPSLRGKLWDFASKRFAASVSGRSTVLIGSRFRGAMSTFMRIERPTVLNRFGTGGFRYLFKP